MAAPDKTNHGPQLPWWSRLLNDASAVTAGAAGRHGLNMSGRTASAIAYEVLDAVADPLIEHGAAKVRDDQQVLLERIRTELARTVSNYHLRQYIDRLLVRMYHVPLSAAAGTDNRDLGRPMPKPDR